MQFDVKCDLMQYDNKIETIVGIHLWNFLDEIVFGGFQKPFQKRPFVNKFDIHWNISLKESNENSRSWFGS